MINLEVMEVVKVNLEAGYLLHIPPCVDSRTLLVLTLHGYGLTPEVMLRLSVAAVGDGCIVASLRGPNQHYLAGSPASEDVGYNWGTRRHPDLNIRLHHEIVQAVAASLRTRFSIPQLSAISPAPPASSPARASTVGTTIYCSTTSTAP